MARVPVQITTERLLTPTPLAPADIEAVHVVFCDLEVMRYAPGGVRDRGGSRARLQSRDRRG